MKMILPEQSMLNVTGETDYYFWNYKFPIKYVQLYRFKTILNLLGDATYPNLLEVGTGSGIFLPELSRHCESLYACDVHPHFENINKLLKSYKVPHFDVSTQSIEKTTYPDNFFDVVIAVSVLEFVKDLNSGINEIKRILKTDGVFITICPMESKILDSVLSLFSRKPPKDEFGDSRKYVKKALEEHFSVVKKGSMVPLPGNIFPVYTYYKLKI
jgi:ubiquinone/menaquinone biosynthesis C-methylase UbiE